ncbi:hypothetical protein F140042L4_07090 [Coprococcus phoceensis]
MELFKLFGTIAIQNADANEQIDDTTDRAKESENKISGAFKKIGAAVGTYFAVDKIKDFGLNCINAAADANAASSQFSQVFGDMESQAKKSLTGIADNTGIQVNRMKGSYTQIAAFAKTTGMDTSNALGLADRAMVAVADSAAFYDRTLEETTESLQSFLKGNYENDSSLGLSCTEVTRNEAANRLYGKSFKDLSEAQKQLTLLQMVEDANKASGALGQAARESDTWTNQTGNLKQAWTDFQSVLGQKVLPLAVEAVKKASEAVQGLSEKMPTIIQTFKDWSPLIAGVVTGFVTLKAAMAISSLISAVTTAWTEYKTANEGATIAQWLLNAALNANPIVLIVSLIAGLVVAIITLWNTNEDFRNKVIEIWEAIKNAFGTAIEAIKSFFVGLWEKIVSVWESIKETISTAIETIKTVVTEKFNAVKETITNIFTSIKDTLSTIWETIKNVIQVAIMFIVELFTTAFELITLPFRFIWENCKEIVMQAWEAIKSAISTALESIKTTITNIWNAIVSFLTPIIEGIKTAFVNNWNAIKTTITNVVNTIKSVVTTVWNAISSTVSSVMNTIKTTISNIWNSIKSTVSSVINAIKSIISSVFNAIKSTISGILNSIKSTFSSIWNSIKSTVSNAINGVKSTISSGLNAAKSVVSGVLEAIKSKFSSIFEGAKNIVRNAINTIKGFFNFSWSLPKIKLPHFSISGKFSLNPPQIPHFSVSWYKKAMDNPVMFTKPTIFSMNPTTGQAKGAGEAGDELMIGKETMLNMIRQAVQEGSNNAGMVRLLEILLQWFMDGGLTNVLIDVLTNHVSFEFDNREIARLIEKYA